MVKLESRRLGDLLILANGLVLILLLNLVSARYFFRVDLTDEKRYSIKESTRDMLNNLDDEVLIEVYLEGDLNTSFKRFQKAIRETLEQFRVYSHNKVRYVFSNPLTASSEGAQAEFVRELMGKGIVPTDVVERSGGESSTKRIFPGALISYEGFETGVNLLQGNYQVATDENINQSLTADQKINRSIEGLEYELARAISKLVNADRKRIGFVTNHREIDSLEIASFNNALLDVYDVFKVDLAKSNLSNYDLLITAKPKNRFTELEKYNLDQFIMNGGRAMFLLDRLDASMDSASSDNYFAFPYDLNLEDQLFKYGVRINMDLVQDRASALYPVIAGEVGGSPQMKLMEWPFFPLINQYADHPITRNLDAVVGKFVSSMDTVKAEGIRKTPLLFTSSYSHRVSAPVLVSVNELRKSIRDDMFKEGTYPVAYLLEGKFTSVFKNRFLPEDVDKDTFKESGADNKILVVADGDIARNEVNPRSGKPLQLGFDPFTNYTFANESFLLNAVAFLTDEKGLIMARNKEVKIRPLDKVRASDEELKWQVVNLVLPLILLIGYGIAREFIRRRKYARF